LTSGRLLGIFNSYLFGIYAPLVVLLDTLVNDTRATISTIVSCFSNLVKIVLLHCNLIVPQF
jgi:hypothetical protein